MLEVTKNYMVICLKSSRKLFAICDVLQKIKKMAKIEKFYLTRRRNGIIILGAFLKI